MGIEVDNGTETKIGFDSFDTVDMKWRFTNTLLNASLFPSYRKYSSSVISPENDALYLIGGTVVDDTYNIPVGIVRYDINNRTYVIDLAIERPSLNLPLLGGSTDMLPNGVVVLAFGADSDLNLYSSSKVLLFSTNTNEIIIQPINGIAPNSRALTSSTLGPDQTTIYYFGGQDRTSLINTFGGTRVSWPCVSLCPVVASGRTVSLGVTNIPEKKKSTDITIVDKVTPVLSRALDFEAIDSEIDNELNNGWGWDDDDDDLFKEGTK
ncbi:hypothetical protein MFLAVUS_006145 [Mucor flavus]|uniref:Uncharacterized protein n=1 Tax=Mucor flavus TaxID=439312 RepID=A0ABP9Z0R3_9FUNG